MSNILIYSRDAWFSKSIDSYYQDINEDNILVDNGVELLYGGTPNIIDTGYQDNYFIGGGRTLQGFIGLYFSTPLDFYGVDDNDPHLAPKPASFIKLKPTTVSLPSNAKSTFVWYSNKISELDVGGDGCVFSSNIIEVQLISHTLTTTDADCVIDIRATDYSVTDIPIEVTGTNTNGDTKLRLKVEKVNSKDKAFTSGVFEGASFNPTGEVGIDLTLSMSDDIILEFEPINNSVIFLQDVNTDGVQNSSVFCRKFGEGRLHINGKTGTANTITTQSYCKGHILVSHLIVQQLLY